MSKTRTEVIYCAICSGYGLETTTDAPAKE